MHATLVPKEQAIQPCIQPCAGLARQPQLESKAFPLRRYGMHVGARQLQGASHPWYRMSGCEHDSPGLPHLPTVSPSACAVLPQHTLGAAGLRPCSWWIVCVTCPQQVSLVSPPPPQGTLYSAGGVAIRIAGCMYAPCLHSPVRAHGHGAWKQTRHAINAAKTACVKRRQNTACIKPLSLQLPQVTKP